MSLIPGIGCPVVTNSTMCAKEVGYGAGGSFGFAEAPGIMPPAVSLLVAGVLVWACAGVPFGTGAGRPREAR